MNWRGVPSIAAALLLVSPVLVGGAYSALAAVGIVGTGSDGFTIVHLTAVVMSSDTWRGVAWTLSTAGAATLLAAAAAIFVAVQVRDSRAGRLLAVLPMGVPHIAAALAALLLFGQSGLLSRMTAWAGITAGPSDFPALVYDPAGVSLVIAFAWKELPYLALTAMAVLLTDTRQLEEVARTLGASPRQAFWRVTWPHLWRGTAPAVLAAFAFLIGQYEMPALLAPSDPVALPLLIYERAVDPDITRRGEAHVLALIAFSICLALVAAHALWTNRTAQEEAR
jgi:putative spermidine/putrescine transport system permease protein